MNDDISDLPLNKQFEYIKLCRDIDTLDNVKELRDLSKKFLLLYINTQYVAGKLADWDFKLSNPE